MRRGRGPITGNDRGNTRNPPTPNHYNQRQDTLDLVCRDQLRRCFDVVGVPVLESDEDSRDTSARWASARKGIIIVHSSIA